MLFFIINKNYKSSSLKIAFYLESMGLKCTINSNIIIFKRIIVLILHLLKNYSLEFSMMEIVMENQKFIFLIAIPRNGMHFDNNTSVNLLIPCYAVNCFILFQDYKMLLI